MDAVQFHALFPAFSEKFMNMSQEWWARDYVELETGQSGYKNPRKQRLKSSHLLQHWKQRPEHTEDRRYGSFAINGLYAQGDRRYIKWNVIDCDDEPEVKVLYEKLLPVLDKYGIQYLLETGGERDERRKLWVFFKDVEYGMAQKLFDQMFQDAGITARDLGGEMFPLNRPIGIVRIPLGYYAKRKKVSPVEINGELTTDPLKFMQAVIDIEPITEEWITANLREEIRTKKILGAAPLVFPQYFTGCP